MTARHTDVPIIGGDFAEIEDTRWDQACRANDRVGPSEWAGILRCVGGKVRGVSSILQVDAP